MTETNRICDYEGSNYRTDFWEGKGRNYEDLVERAVIAQLLPKQGKRIIEIGAAYGRLVNLYGAFEQVVLLDYSFSQLQYARQHLGDGRFIYVAADAYRLPFQRGVFDCATMIRVLHHFENVPSVLAGIRRIIADRGHFLLEFANKHNLKALVRHTLGQQAWNPNELSPVEFVELNFNFHPQYIQNELQKSGFATQARVPVSFFRMGALKRRISNERLAQMDTLLQRTGWMVAPSIFTLNSMQSASTALDNTHLQGDAMFACPLTGGELRREGDTLQNADGVRWAIQDGIYNFKEPLG
jgi:SAM-dependent methyltransferase